MSNGWVKGAKEGSKWGLLRSERYTDTVGRRVLYCHSDSYMRVLAGQCYSTKSGKSGNHRLI